MELNKCLGCMEDLTGYPCSKCGFDPRQTGNAEYALPVETILAGKYLVGKVLGQGGFGITYIGWNLALEQKVAIKEYYPSGQVSRQPGTQQLTWYTSESARFAQESGMEMFLKEARKMAKVEDISGIVKVKDLFRENGTAYIVMDFVEGETLKNRLKQTGPMSWKQAKEIFRPAIQTMEKVHRAGLVHRDISPDNLMLTPTGDVKILDLGAAKDLNVNTGASSMQVAKSGFSPLEQYTQRGGSGPWTDVYSMAATIYYTLTGKIPPTAIDRMENDAICWTQPRLDTLPRAALAALKKAMVVSAQKRTQSMEELKKGLFEKGSEPEIDPETESDPEPKPEPKPAPKMPGKTIWAAVAAAVVVMVGVIWMTGLKSDRDYKKAQRPMETEQYEAARFETSVPETEAEPETSVSESEFTSEPFPENDVGSEDPSSDHATKSSQTLQPGQTVTIGHYPKASDSITWQVLDVQGDKALLIAQKGLDVQPYNTKYGSVTWETSSLRNWLNTTFLNESFTAEEQKAIRTTYVDNGKAQGCDLWETDGGNNTQDKIFLLSYGEAKKYFDIATPGIDGPEKARIQPTKYAEDQGAYVSEEFKTADGKDATRWWLRSPGCNQLDAACVHARGCIGEQMCSNKDTCVRPAMWVDCNKINSR